MGKKKQLPGTTPEAAGLKRKRMKGGKMIAALFCLYFNVEIWLSFNINVNNI